MGRHGLRAVLATLAIAVLATAHAFDLQGHRGARGLAPENGLAAFAAALSLGVTTLELDTGGRVWSPYFGDVDAANLTHARALGLAVVVWTVNSPADIARMLDLGVDGIISDRPDLVRAQMQSRGIPLPVPTPVSP